MENSRQSRWCSVLCGYDHGEFKAVLQKDSFAGFWVVIVTTEFGSDTLALSANNDTTLEEASFDATRALATYFQEIINRSKNAILTLKRGRSKDTMGCDIHLHAEVKIKGKWHHHSEYDVCRNYRLFAKMAGVRNGEGIKPIASPRGIPADVSTLTMINVHKWGDDGHSHSWLNAKEIYHLERWVEAELLDNKGFLQLSGYWGYLFGNNWGDFHKHPELRHEDIEDVRFVFWFDS